MNTGQSMNRTTCALIALFVSLATPAAAQDQEKAMQEIEKIYLKSGLKPPYFKELKENLYKNIERVSFQDIHFRKDIGFRAIRHML